MNHELRAVASAYGGVFTRVEARRCGYTDEQIERLVRIGEWTRLRKALIVETGLLNACDAVPRHALDVRAAQRRLKRATVASHSSAVFLHGISLLDPPGLAWLTSAVGRPKSYDGMTVSVAGLPTAHLHDQRVHGLGLVSYARGLIDLARTLSFRDAVVSMDDALHRGLVTKDELFACLAECPDWPGATAARDAINFAEPKTESPAESLSRVMFLEQDIEMPEPQVWIESADGVVKYRVDFYWRRRRVIGEVDGKVKLESGDPQTLWEEKRREDDLREDHEVVRWGYADARYGKPRTAAKIRAAFARAERRAS